MASASVLAGSIAVCAAAALTLLAPPGRKRDAAMIAALVLAFGIVGVRALDNQLSDLRDTPVQLAAVLAGSAAIVAALAYAMRRWAWAMPLAVFAAMPLRAPVPGGGETLDVLLPLYAVLAAAAIVTATTRRPDRHPFGGPSLWLVRALAASLLLYALQSAYSDDAGRALETACFFLAPFAVLMRLLAEVRWDERLLRQALLVTVCSGVGFALVGFAELAARDLLLNSELVEANQAHLYFRVNSVFHDPNLYARQLVLVLVAIGAVLAWGLPRRYAYALAAAAAVLLAGVATSLSMSACIALLAGLLAVAALRFGLGRGAVAAAAVFAVAGAFFALGGSPDRHVNAASDDITSGRVGLVEGGLELAGNRPLSGYGSASFGVALEKEAGSVGPVVESHSEPITVAAEQGVPGLAVYAAVVLASLVVVLAGSSGSAARCAVAACYLALLVHTLAYATFTSDPHMWALLALGVAVPATPRPQTN